MPQLCAMSVALLAHGEMVPKRGITTNCSPSSLAAERFAIGQQRAQARDIVVGQCRRAIDEVMETS